MGKKEEFLPNHCKVCPLFPASSLLFSKADKSSWAGSMLLFPWAPQSWSNLIFLCLTFSPASLPLIMCCCLENKLSGPGTTICHKFDKCVEQCEPPNLYLHVTTIMMLIIISTWPVYKPTPSGLTRKFCCLQSWVPEGSRPSEGLVFQDAHHYLKVRLFTLST